ncbi:MAG: triose-phosphate isomerase [bacterium]|nr:triose-phosphate isomerase [Candidatus Kapabacteria bacterium]
MRTSIVAGNWKMNTDRASGLALIDAIVARVGSGTACEVIVCPPFTLLDAASQKLSGTSIRLGAQNVYFEREGAFTGEISTAMLGSVGCSHVIVGHSERRTLFGETDEYVARKIAATIAANLIPIVCVGETLEERDRGDVENVIGRQIDVALRDIELRDGTLAIVIAYEPVWAIGTGRTATPAQAQDVHHFIRERVATLHTRAAADSVRILYGGSVNADNAVELFGCADIDGGLIGGASLKVDSFMTIIDATQSNEHPSNA